MYSITEAFKKLNILDEEFFDPSSDEDLEDLDELTKSDYQMADDAVDEIEIIDPKAENEDEILDDYTDRIIIQCPVCKSLFYKKEDDIDFDESADELVNEGEECPYCLTSGGYKIVGKVAPFVPEDTEVEIDGEEVTVDYDDDDAVDDDDDIEVEDDVEDDVEDFDEESEEEEDEDLEEGCCKGKNCNESLNEQFEEVSIKTGDQEMEMSQDPETQEVSVKSRPRQALDNGDTMIAPMNDEEIEGVADIDTGDELEDEELGEDEFEEEPLPEEEPEFEGEGEFGDEDFNEEGEELEDEIDVEDFDEESGDQAFESYFRQVYDNVNRFATTGTYKEGNKLIVEGNLRFSSGNTHKTTFAFKFDGMTPSTQRARFIGENREITRGKKAFCLTGKLDEGKFICESLRYHYKAKDAEGVSRRLYNTIYVK